MGSWTDNIKDIEPYVPGEQSAEKGIIKLNANENPYPPSPMVKKALRELDFDSLRLYPDANAAKLKDAIAAFYGVERENVFVGNGSDDVLALAFQAFFNGEKPVLFPDITYSFYPVWCRLFGIPFKTVPVGGDFRICADDYAKENGGVVIPNPNAPTSLGEGAEFVESILRKNQGGVVIIDEAYVDFGGFSSAGLTEKYENLLVTATFSKSRSLAGMRLGYAIGSKKLTGALEAVKNSYNSYTVNSAAMAAGAAAMRDTAYFNETVQKIIATRVKTKAALEELGFEVLDSQTNFLMATHPEKNMREYFEFLKTQKIFIRYFDKPVINKFVRITVGTDDEMNALLLKTREFLETK